MSGSTSVIICLQAPVRTTYALSMVRYLQTLGWVETSISRTSFPTYGCSDRSGERGISMVVLFGLAVAVAQAVKAMII